MELLSPAGARVVTCKRRYRICARYVAVPRRGASCYAMTANSWRLFLRCCPPQGRELLRYRKPPGAKGWLVAVPRRGASCYAILSYDIIDPQMVAVPRRGASCYFIDSINYLHSHLLLSPAGARVVTAKMRKIQCGFSAFLQSFCIIFCIFAYPFVILSVFSGANLPVATLFIVIITRGSHQINLCCTSGVSACTVKATAHN